MRHIACRFEAFGNSTAQTDVIYHLDYRNYIPIIASFSQREPLLSCNNPDLLKPYSYAKSNPPNLKDPHGLFYRCECDQFEEFFYTRRIRWYIWGTPGAPKTGELIDGLPAHYAVFCECWIEINVKRCVGISHFIDPLLSTYNGVPIWLLCLDYGASYTCKKTEGDCGEGDCFIAQHIASLDVLKCRVGAHILAIGSIDVRDLLDRWGIDDPAYYYDHFLFSLLRHYCYARRYVLEHSNTFPDFAVILPCVKCCPNWPPGPCECATIIKPLGHFPDFPH